MFLVCSIKYIRFKRNKQKCNFHYAAVFDCATDFEICGFHKKTQKSSYLGNETFFLQIKNSVITHQGLLYSKKFFCSGDNI